MRCEIRTNIGVGLGVHSIFKTSHINLEHRQPPHVTAFWIKLVARLVYSLASHWIPSQPPVFIILSRRSLHVKDHIKSNPKDPIKA